MNRPAPIVLGLAVVGLAMAWSRSNPARPMVVVAGGPAFPCGTTPRGTFGRHSWTLRNAGPAPLKLRTRFTSGHCGFNLWQGEEHVIPSGEEITVSLTWPTPENEATPYSDHAEVWTNDPSTPRVRFRIVGMTGPDLPSTVRADQNP